jgi:hypothetical protein
MVHRGRGALRRGRMHIDVAGGKPAQSDNYRSRGRIPD